MNQKLELELEELKEWKNSIQIWFGGDPNNKDQKVMKIFDVTFDDFEDKEHLKVDKSDQKLKTVYLFFINFNKTYKYCDF